MGFLNLVKQKNRERVFFNGICELATSFIAHISRRGTQTFGRCDSGYTRSYQSECSSSHRQTVFRPMFLLSQFYRYRLGRQRTEYLSVLHGKNSEDQPYRLLLSSQHQEFLPSKVLAFNSLAEIVQCCFDLVRSRVSKVLFDAITIEIHNGGHIPDVGFSFLHSLRRPLISVKLNPSVKPTNLS